MMKAEASTTTHQCKQKDTLVQVDRSWFFHHAVLLCVVMEHMNCRDTSKQRESFSYHLFIFTVNPSFFLHFVCVAFFTIVPHFFFLVSVGEPLPRLSYNIARINALLVFYFTFLCIVPFFQFSFSIVGFTHTMIVSRQQTLPICHFCLRYSYFTQSIE